MGDQPPNPEWSESAVLAKIEALERYLGGPIEPATPINPQRASAREKLIRLSRAQFQELAVDVIDEMTRRLAGANAPSALQHRELFHVKRNQARQKLSTLPDLRFKDLTSDVYSELKRRFPRGKGSGSVRGKDIVAAIAAQRMAAAMAEQQGQKLAGLPEAGPTVAPLSRAASKPAMFTNALAEELRTKVAVAPTNSVSSEPRSTVDTAPSPTILTRRESASALLPSKGGNVHPSSVATEVDKHEMYTSLDELMADLSPMVNADALRNGRAGAQATPAAAPVRAGVIDYPSGYGGVIARASATQQQHQQQPSVDLEQALGEVRAKHAAETEEARRRYSERVAKLEAEFKAKADAYERRIHELESELRHAKLVTHASVQSEESLRQQIAANDALNRQNATLLSTTRQQDDQLRALREQLAALVLTVLFNNPN